MIPPHPFLESVRQAIQGSRVKLGAQDVYVEDKGAYTGGWLMFFFGGGGEGGGR